MEARMIQISFLVLAFMGDKKSNTANNVMALLSNAGIRSIRDEAYWSSIEELPGRLMFSNDLSDLDKLLYGIYSKGGRPMIVLAYGNVIYYKWGQTFIDGGRKEFNRYAEYIAHGMPCLIPALPDF